ncbi:MAG TPA: hypothetical protein VM889_13445 [Candidatus Thermoplasmatota archaeon]|nr:hypothetical protein [Candidatus Thermoplasmatota archaeon]
MRPAVVRPVLLAALVVALAFAGCVGESGNAPAPSKHREETRTFDLAPGKSLEFKLRLAKGAKLDYQWTATRAVAYDFHGDTGGATGYRSHDKGTAATDQGAWTAPFEGRHGWWWKNDNRVPVTVTLVIEGAYEVIGVE